MLAHHLGAQICYVCVARRESRVEGWVNDCLQSSLRHATHSEALERLPVMYLLKSKVSYIFFPEMQSKKKKKKLHMKNHLSGLTKKFSTNTHYIVSAHCQAILQRGFFLSSQSGTSIFWYTNLSAWSRRKTKMSKIRVWKSGGCNFTAQSVSRRQNKQMCFSEQAFYTNLQNLSSQKPSWNTRLFPVCMGATDSLSRGSAPPKKRQT